jgi:hypothetical protein
MALHVRSIDSTDIRDVRQVRDITPIAWSTTPRITAVGRDYGLADYDDRSFPQRRGHTDGLEPNVTEAIVKLMTSAQGRKLG